MSWAVVRVRGSVNVNPKIKETMKLMRLNRVNHCVIVPENDTYTGMLNIIKDYVTWGEIDSDTTELLLQSSGKTSGNSDFSKEHLKETVNYDLPDDVRDRLEIAVLETKVMPSMRCLMAAGEALKKENIAGYNCSFVRL